MKRRKKNKPFLCVLSAEMLAVLDAARGEASRSAFVENQLKKTALIQRQAADLGVELPDRPADGRGKHGRQKYFARRKS